MLDQTTATLPLLAAAELWLISGPEAGPTVDSACYLGLDALADASRESAHHARRHPVAETFADLQPRIVNDLADFGFLVKEAADMVGIAAAVLIPTYRGAEVDRVLVLYLRGPVGDGQNPTGACGAAELWTGSRGRFELSRSAGHYADLERFERVSQYVNFPRGAGLPGICWETFSARIVPDVGVAKGFLRSAGQGPTRLTVGLGLPIVYRTDLRAVLLLLSSARCPLVPVQEVWVQDPGDPQRIVRGQGVYGGLMALADATRDLSCTVGDGLVGRAWSTAAPQILEGDAALASLGSKRLEAARDAGIRLAIAVPVVVPTGVRCVVTLMG